MPNISLARKKTKTNRMKEYVAIDGYNRKTSFRDDVKRGGILSYLPTISLAQRQDAEPAVVRMGSPGGVRSPGMVYGVWAIRVCASFFFGGSPFRRGGVVLRIATTNVQCVSLRRGAHGVATTNVQWWRMGGCMDVGLGGRTLGLPRENVLLLDWRSRRRMFRMLLLRGRDTREC